ncbi:MAG: hypothetical protein ACE5JL_19100, partial [Dehalococcoidia bacterium]
MTDIETKDLYGVASIIPAGEVLAGSHGTWTLTYVVGSKGVASGGVIRAYTECDTDWGVPQLDNPQGEDYMILEAPDHARIAVLVEDVKSVLMVVKGRGLRSGEKVVLTFGDRSGGGPGS